VLASKCHLCTMSCKSISAEAVGEYGNTTAHVFTLSDFGPVSMNEPSVNLYLGTSEPHEECHIALGSREVRFAFLRPHDRGFQVPHYIMCETTWSGTMIKQVKCWLKHCIDSHHNCDHQSERNSLPLRLIDVDPRGSISSADHLNGDTPLSILETMPEVISCSSSGLPMDKQYLTLSHRWDSIPTLCLSNETQSLFIQGLPPSLLGMRGSKTLRDAIEVTRHLVFRYLWIDTICINQDDNTEEASEISSMDQIYKNSMLNISATGATTAADGLFYKRSPLRFGKGYPPT
jgi:hypothetical protein